MYSLFPLPSIEEFPCLLESHPLLCGLNVTIPYKEEVIKYLDSVSEEAREIGAVNVIRIEEKAGKKFLLGYNSDYEGFMHTLPELLPRHVDSALILGTGGAAKAIKYALGKLDIKASFVSRRPDAGDFTYEELDENIMKDNLLIVNATPAGMSPDIDSFPPIPYHLLSYRHLCYDLVYNPEVTQFMLLSAKHGAAVKNGYGMLIEQAKAAARIWNI